MRALRARSLPTLLLWGARDPVGWRSGDNAFKGHSAHSAGHIPDAPTRSQCSTLAPGLRCAPATCARVAFLSLPPSAWPSLPPSSTPTPAQWITISRAERIRALYPEASLVAIDDAGHCPHDDAPKETSEALIGWLQRLPA